MRRIVAFATVLVALAATAVAQADYQVAVHVGGQTMYMAVANGSPGTTFKLRRTVPGVTMHRSYDSSSLILSGTVRDVSTIPVNAAPITAQVASVTGDGWATVATALSNVNGWFAVKVPAGDSRLIRLWAGASYLTFKELVSPSLRLYVRAQRNHRLRFTGALRIGWAGQQPPVVEIDSRTLRGWATLAAVKVGRYGTFGYTYESPPQTRGYRFQFRLATLSTAAWSWAASPLASAVVR